MKPIKLKYQTLSQIDYRLSDELYDYLWNELHSVIRIRLHTELEIELMNRHENDTDTKAVK